MAAILTSNHPKLLWPGINAVWGVYNSEWPKEYTDLFEMNTSRQMYEEDVQINRFGLAPAIPEFNPVTYDTETQGYVTRYTPTVYGLGYIVSREERETNLYEKVAASRTKSLGFSMNQTREMRAADIYNNAFTSGTGGDGQYLCVTTHPTLAGNQSNLLTAADFSQAALEDALITIRKTKDARGLQIPVRPRSLHIPPDLIYEVERVMTSTLQSNTAENAINVVRGSVPRGWFVNTYFDDTDAWFIRTDVQDGMKMFVLRDLEFSDDGDWETDGRKYKSTMWFSVGWTDWRALYGNVGV